MYKAKIIAGLGLFVLGELFFNLIIYVMGCLVTKNLSWFTFLTVDNQALISIFEYSFGFILILFIIKVVSMVDMNTHGSA